MAAEKKLYRARQSIGGGVCTGIAEYFKIDPIIVQIITVILTLATGGLLAIAYIALWVILPEKPDPEAPVEVQAHEVHSDTYGPVEYRSTDQKSATSKQKTTPETRYEPYAGNAHVPPEPPKSSDKQAARGTTASYSPADIYTTVPPTAQVPYNPAAVPVAPEDPSKAAKKEGREQSAANGALWFGLILLFIGLVALLGEFITGVEWWQFWPLLFVIGGIGQMIVPGKKGHRKRRFSNGFMQFIFGVAALPFSLGFISLESLEPIFVNLWPILLIMCGLFILGAALDTPLFTLLACLCFVVFCVVGLGWFSYPGPTEMITLTLPTGQSYNFSLGAWL